MRVVVTGGAGFIGANLAAPPGGPGATRSWRSTTSAPGRRRQPRRHRRVAGRRLHPRRRRCSTASWPVPTPSSTSPPGRRCPARSAIPWPPTGSTPPARSRCSRRSAEPGSPAPPGPRGLVVVRLRRQPRPPQARGPGHAPGEPLRRQQAGHRGLRPGLGGARSASTCWPSASSTCSARCSPPATPTPPSSPPSSTPRSPAGPLPVHGDGTAEPRLHLRRLGLPGARRRRRAGGSRRPSRSTWPSAAGSRCSSSSTASSASSGTRWSASTCRPGRATCRTRRPTRRASGPLFPDVEPVSLEAGLRATVAWFRAQLEGAPPA